MIHRIPAGDTAPRMARDLLSGLREAVADDQLAIARLLVSELVTNGLLHARPHSGGAYELRVTLAPPRLRISVCDGGTGFEPRPRVADPFRPGGWGLVLVERLSDAWGVERIAGGTEVWFCLRLR